MLLQRRNAFQSIFFDLLNDIFSVFSFKLSVILNKLCVFKFQISSTSSFVITDYKIQNATYSNVVLNFRRDNRIRSDANNHKKFCFTYVQFFRLQIFEDFQLLQNIQFKNIDNKFHSNFLNEIKFFNILSEITLTSWTNNFEKRRQWCYTFHFKRLAESWNRLHIYVKELWTTNIWLIWRILIDFIAIIWLKFRSFVDSTCINNIWKVS